MKPQEKLSELQKLLLVSPHADKVYFNEAGDYQLYDHPEYQHQIVTRDEVLEVDIEQTVSTEATTVEDANPVTDDGSGLHTITQEDLDTNPDLVTQDLRVGDKVSWEKPTEETITGDAPAPAPAPKSTNKNK